MASASPQPTEKRRSSCLKPIMDDRLSGAQCRFGVDHRRQLVEVPGHQFGRIFGLDGVAGSPRPSSMNAAVIRAKV
jgi:hypothetical protein